jgi:hypothetical protein
MPTQADFAATYQNMSDGQLLETANQGGLIPEAHQALTQELHRRNLKPSDLPRHKESPRERLQGETREKWYASRTGPTGLVFFGRRYLAPADREANIQLRTKWISLGGLPIFPLASYRFKCKQQGWRFLRWTDQTVLNRVPLNWDQAFSTWLKASPFYVAIFVLLYAWLMHRPTH